jgi:hypothetical protein
MGTFVTRASGWRSTIEVSVFGDIERLIKQRLSFASRVDARMSRERPVC